MKNLKEAIDKIDKLEYISNAYKVAESDFRERYNLIKKLYAMIIDVKMESFLLYVNGKSYYECVRFNSINSIPVYNGNVGDIGLFYSLVTGVQYDMLARKISNNDIIMPQDWLLAEASPGDFIVISFASVDYGKFFFISHDSNENEQTRYLVANNIEDFIDSLFIDNEDE